MTLVNAIQAGGVAAPPRINVFQTLTPELRNRIYEIVAHMDPHVLIQALPATLGQHNPQSRIDVHITGRDGLSRANKLYRTEYHSVLAGEFAKDSGLFAVYAHIVDFDFAFLTHFITSLTNADVIMRGQSPVRRISMSISFSKNFIHDFDGTDLKAWFDFCSQEQANGRRHRMAHIIRQIGDSSAEDYKALMCETAWFDSPNMAVHGREVRWFKQHVVDRANDLLRLHDSGMDARASNISQYIPVLATRKTNLMFEE